MLGHLRHEIGHYYWTVLVERAGRLDEFRALFGDERARLRRRARPPLRGRASRRWEDRYVSPYATMHPWEDWAETFAHFLHILDTLQTAAAYGVIVTGPTTGDRRDLDPDLVAAPANRSPTRPRAHPRRLAAPDLRPERGQPQHGPDDLYPFVLSPQAMAKLAFVHDLVRGA